MPNELHARPYVLILLAAVIITVWSSNLDYHNLFRPDEGRYAEIAREMAVTGDWVTPQRHQVLREAAPAILGCRDRLQALRRAPLDGPAVARPHIARDIKPHLTEKTLFFSVSTYDQTLPFYIKRTVTMVVFQGELAYGLEREPQLSIPDIPSFERAWRSEPGALAIMEPHTYAELTGRKLPMQIVARDFRRIVVRSPGAAP